MSLMMSQIEVCLFTKNTEICLFLAGHFHILTKYMAFGYSLVLKSVKGELKQLSYALNTDS